MVAINQTNQLEVMNKEVVAMSKQHNRDQLLAIMSYLQIPMNMQPLNYFIVVPTVESHHGAREADIQLNDIIMMVTSASANNY